MQNVLWCTTKLLKLVLKNMSFIVKKLNKIVHVRGWTILLYKYNLIKQTFHFFCFLYISKQSERKKAN